MNSDPPNPTPYPLLRDISNFKTPKRVPCSKPAPSPSALFFSASAKPLRTPRRISFSNKKTATARRLKQFELEQCRTSRNAQLKKEQSLKSLSKALATWLNFLLQNPNLCGCGSNVDDGRGSGGLGKRSSTGTQSEWRWPKRHKGVITWHREDAAEEGSVSVKNYGALRRSLRDVCSFDDLKERMMGYLSLLCCNEVFDIMTHVVKVIDEGRLKMKSHCPVITDVGMKENAIRILMCYNPIWLRIGLHIVFGGDSLLIDENVSSEQEMLFLKMVIEKQFFSHSGLSKIYAYNKNVEGLYKPGYFEALGNMILKRFLLLVLVLDRAKSQSMLSIKYGIDGIDGGSPPLFVPQSSIKSSREVINDFLPSEVMHGQGNLLAHLVIIGYKVSYQQCPLVDYEFKVKDLFMDLQDGVRLCRAIQLLKKDASILAKVLVPSKSHKKNLANCGLALQYLRRAGVSMNDEDGMTIMEDDIANGDKELTVSLLWNIFIQLQLPLLIDNQILVKEIEKVLGTNEDFSQNLNLGSSPLELLRTWIQVVCKKYDYEVNSFSSLVDGKAIWCILDYYFRKELFCSHSIKNTGEGNCEESLVSSIDHSDAVHNFILSQKLTTLLGDFPEVLETSDILEHGGANSEQSVVVLLVFLASQLTVKKTVDQLNFHKLLECGCQSSEKRCSSVKRYSKSLRTSQEKEEIAEHNNEDAARKFKAIKAWWQDMAEQNNKFLTKPVSSTSQRNSISHPNINIEKVNAAIIIQSYFRQSSERKKFMRLKVAVSFLQTVVRAWLFIKKKQLNCSRSVVMAQHLRSEKQNVSEKVRRYVQFIYDRNRFLKIQRSVLVIQRATRIWNARRKLVKGVTNNVLRPLDIVSAAVVIQKHTRGWTARSKYQVIQKTVSCMCEVNRLRNLEEEAATKIQLYLKKIVARRCLRDQHRAATKIQTNIRGWLLRKKFQVQKHAVTTIQSNFRVWMLRRKFIQHHAATKIQNNIRGWQLRRKFMIQKHAATTIESNFRGYLLRRKFLTQKSAVITIQSSFRGQLLRRKFLIQKHAIKTIQSNFGCWLLRRKLLLQKHAVTTIQSNFRGWLLRRDYLVQKHAATTIQSNFRSWLWKRKLLTQKHAATTIQSNYRGWLWRRKFLIQKHAAITIQRNSRGWQWRRKFLIQKHAAITIQRNSRGWLWRRKFLIQKHAAITIQKNSRGWLLRRNFLIQKHAVTVIQSNFRVWLLRRNYLVQKHAVTTIQSYFRGWHWRRKFLIQKHAATTIQSYFRRVRCWKALQQLKVTTKLRSVIVIQSHVRRWIHQRRARRRRNFVCVIQRCFRGWMIKRNFVLRKEAVTTIQSAIRGFNCQKMLDSRKQAVVAIQRFVRGWITRKKLLGASHLLEENNTTISNSSLDIKVMLPSIIKLQRWWRHALHTRRMQSAIAIQSHVRGWLVREKASRDRQRVTVIQSYWKGYLARKESGSQLTDLCSRVQKTAKNVDDSMRILNRLKLALSELPKMKSITEILRTCATLEMATENSQRCCEELVAAGAVDNLLKLIQSVTQSKPDQQILKHALSTLRNLARYQHLIEVLVNSNGSVETIFWVMLRNKEEGYFIASAILRKICKNQKGLKAVQKLPSYVKRLHMLVEELTKKATNERKAPRSGGVNMDRRLREAVELLKMMMET